MKDLNYQLSKLCRDNRDGSFSTQATRSRILDLIASQLQGLGYHTVMIGSATGIAFFTTRQQGQQADHENRGQNAH